MQRYINTKQNSRSTAVTHDQNPTQKLSVDFYKIPSKDMQIIFIDSMSGYERLLDRLFKVNNEDQELFIGFDCMLFYSIFTINLFKRFLIIVLSIDECRTFSPICSPWIDHIITRMFTPSPLRNGHNSRKKT